MGMGKYTFVDFTKRLKGDFVNLIAFLTIELANKSWEKNAMYFYKNDQWSKLHIAFKSFLWSLRTIAIGRAL